MCALSFGPRAMAARSAFGFRPGMGGTTGADL